MLNTACARQHTSTPHGCSPIPLPGGNASLRPDDALLVAEFRNYLAVTYSIAWPNRGRHRTAAALYDASLQARSELLGDEHPDTATSLNNKANFLHNNMRHHVKTAAADAKELCVCTHPSQCESRLLTCSFW